MNSLKSLKMYQQLDLNLNSFQTVALAHSLDLETEDNKSCENSIIELNHKIEVDLLLPSLLQTLCKQNRFITIIGSPRKLDKNWFKKNKLPLDKFIQINSGLPNVQTMRLALGALSSGNSSGVITWLSDICKGQFQQLEQAASYGGSKAIIMPLFESYQ